MKIFTKPLDGEFSPYTILYISKVPDDGRIIEHLDNQQKAMTDFFLSLPEDKLIYRYSENKWTIKEILLHCTDTERVFNYRALHFARNGATQLPGFDENLFASASMANERGIEDLLAEYSAVRQATISLFSGFTDEMLMRRGIANNHTYSVRACAYVIAGHELHHLGVIKDRYL